jgi:multicomponent Na+:H+ antiporter subunit B
MIETIVDLTNLTFLAITALAIARMRNLFAVVMLFSVFSLISAGLFVVMDAADVAFTEAAVGAGISTVLMLATLALTYSKKDKKDEHRSGHKPWLPLVVVFITGAMLIYGTSDIPDFGDPGAPAQIHVAPYYLEKSLSETGVQNVVTAVLASYRGFDTLGEVTVIFTAAIAVLLLVGGRRKSTTINNDRDSHET